MPNTDSDTETTPALLNDKNHNLELLNIGTVLGTVLGSWYSTGWYIT
jgi:hypothetical protein